MVRKGTSMGLVSKSVASLSSFSRCFVSRDTSSPGARKSTTALMRGQLDHALGGQVFEVHVQLEEGREIWMSGLYRELFPACSESSCDSHLTGTSDSELNVSSLAACIYYENSTFGATELHFAKHMESRRLFLPRLSSAFSFHVAADNITQHKSGRSSVSGREERECISPPPGSGGVVSPPQSTDLSLLPISPRHATHLSWAPAAVWRSQRWENVALFDLYSKNGKTCETF
ncbi:hypothetical protein WMY93_022966 [Mugilogobius chulae]|uniref:Uncharacterized protein n=1 Tax=Mugilogobius chulae TaxID=88201 RepID=A0AAW0N7X0_9GOBI